MDAAPRQPPICFEPVLDIPPPNPFPLASQSLESMNLPNKLTVSRFVLTAVFMVVLFAGSPHCETAALVVFIIASLTDFFDGKIARARNLITDFGKLMDPLADKVLMCSAFIAFVGLADPHQDGRMLLPAWMAVVIVARELAITGLRLLAANKDIVLAAEGAGKHKTISQIICICANLVLICYPQWTVGGQAYGKLVFGAWLPLFTHCSEWVAVLLTIYSGGLYLWNNRAIFLEDR